MQTKLANGLQKDDFAVYTRYGYALVKIEEISNADRNVQIEVVN